MKKLKNPEKIKFSIHISGVYFLYLKGELLYIGKSANVHKRIATHEKKIKFDSFKIVKCDRNKMHYLESAYIRKYKPKINWGNWSKKMKNDKSYNTPEYREAKRIVAFVSPKLKKAILQNAKQKLISISKEISEALGKVYGIK